uniref:Uncharacterized protein n=1 Tax=Arundo donax TaxID=35708 RepID=A0A0A9B4W3_ARUDO
MVNHIRSMLSSFCLMFGIKFFYPPFTPMNVWLCKSDCTSHVPLDHGPSRTRVKRHLQDD